jgi:hypothetical protein
MTASAAISPALASINICDRTVYGDEGSIAVIWEKEMMQQTKSLREDAHRLSPRNKARAPVRKRSPRG